MHTYESNAGKKDIRDEMQLKGTHKNIDIISQNKKDVQNTKTSCGKKFFKYLSLHVSFLFQRFVLGKKPQRIKYAVHSTSYFNNQGSATLEAVCIMPIMLFAFLAFYSMGQIYIMENQIYQAAINTAEYLAEYAYFIDTGEDRPAHGTDNVSPMSLEDSVGVQLLGIGLANARFQYYLGENERVSRYVKAGSSGVYLISEDLLDKEGFINFQVVYQVQIPVPLFNHFSVTLRQKIHQKAYTGYVPSGESENENDVYVYVTEYGTVYHMTRNCSHLQLTIQPVTKNALIQNYGNLEPCEYCGTKETELYYVTEYGERYHTSTQCTGLKRTITRVPLSEVSGLAPCSECGN